MKILHLLAQLPGKTGSGVYFRNVIDRLAPCGHEQRALFAVQDGETFDLLPPEHRYPVEFGTGALPFPVAGMSDVMPYNSTVYSQMDEHMLAAWTAAFRKRMEGAKREFDPDIVLTHHLWILTSLAAEVFDTAVKIGVCHNTDLRQALQNPALKEQYVTNISKLDAVFALSAEQVPEIADVYGYSRKNITVVGGGFDENLFHPPENKVRDKEQVRIAFAGKIAPSKGVFELVRAFNHVCKGKNNVFLDIVGNPNKESAEQLRELIGDNPRVRLLPSMTQRDLADYLRGQDIFVMPSFFEGIGLMAIESLASGLLVVASEIVGLMSLLGEKVNRSGVIEYIPMPRLYETDKPVEEDLDAFVGALADKLLRQIERIERGITIPDSIRAEIQKHSWRSISGEIDAIMMQLFKQHTT